MSSGNQQVIRNVLMNIAAGLGSIFVGLFLFPFESHRVGTDLYGMWLLFSAMMVYFTQSDFGMASAVIKYTAEALAIRDQQYLSRVATTSLVFFAGLGVVGSISYIGFAAMMWDGFDIQVAHQDEAVRLILAVSMFGLLSYIPLKAFQAVLNGAQRYDIERGFLLIGIIARVVLTLTLLRVTSRVEVVALGQLLMTLLPAILSMVYVRRNMPEVKIGRDYFDLGLLKGMLPYSLKAFMMSSMALIVLQTNNLVVGAMLSVSLVVTYGAGYKLYQLVRSLAEYITAPMLPKASELSIVYGKEAVTPLFLRVTKYTVAIALLAGFPVLVLARPFTELWLGTAAGEAASVAQILIVSFLVNAMHLGANTVFAGIGKPGRYLRLHTAWAIGNVGLSIYLATKIGLVGVAIGTALPIVILEPFYVVIACREFNTTLGDFLKQAVRGPWVSGVGAVILLSVLVYGLGAPATWLTLILYTLVYGLAYLLIFWFAGLEELDRVYIRQALTRLTHLIAARG